MRLILREWLRTTEPLPPGEKGLPNDTMHLGAGVHLAYVHMDPWFKTGTGGRGEWLKERPPYMSLCILGVFCIEHSARHFFRAS